MLSIWVWNRRYQIYISKRRPNTPQVTNLDKLFSNWKGGNQFIGGIAGDYFVPRISEGASTAMESFHRKEIVGSKITPNMFVCTSTKFVCLNSCTISFMWSTYIDFMDF